MFASSSAGRQIVDDARFPVWEPHFAGRPDFSPKIFGRSRTRAQLPLALFLGASRFMLVEYRVSISLFEARHRLAHGFYFHGLGCGFFLPIPQARYLQRDAGSQGLHVCTLHLQRREPLTDYREAPTSRKKQRPRATAR